MNDPKKYVVNSKTGESITVNNVEELVSFGVSKWNPDYECFMYDEKDQDLIVDEYIDELISMFSSSLKIDSSIDNILLEGKKIKNQKSATILEKITLKKRGLLDQKVYVIDTNNFKLTISNGGYRFSHLVNGNYLKYKDVKTNKILKPTITNYLSLFFKKSIRKIVKEGRVGTIKQANLFKKVIVKQDVNKGFISDWIHLVDIRGFGCFLKSGVLKTTLQFIQPNGKKFKEEPVDSLMNIMKYLKKK